MAPLGLNPLRFFNMGAIEENFITGWIKVYRSLSKEAFYTKSEHVHLFVHLLIKATHTPKEYLWNGRKLVLFPGQYITGRKRLSEETGIHESKIERILNYFEKIEQLIEQQKTASSRLITILSFDRYQNSEQQNEQPVNNERTTTEQPVNNERTLNKNIRIKEHKNIRTKEELVFPFESIGFKTAWGVLINEKKWRRKSFSALQAALKKLSQFPEADAIQMIENTIAGEWQGIFELKKSNNAKQSVDGNKLFKDALSFGKTDDSNNF